MNTRRNGEPRPALAPMIATIILGMQNQVLFVNVFFVLSMWTNQEAARER